MCIQHPNRNESKSAATTATEPFQVDGVEVKRGSKWVFRGKQYRVIDVGRKYLFTNGDPETLYLAIDEVGGEGRFIITHRRFIDEATPEQPLVERFITVGQILDAGPCVDGVRALARILGMPGADSIVDEKLVYKLMMYFRGSDTTPRKVSDLYDGYKRVYSNLPDTSWLLFIAQALNLVPKGMSHMDRATLKRMLGIKP